MKSKIILLLAFNSVAFAGLLNDYGPTADKCELSQNVQAQAPLAVEELNEQIRNVSSNLAAKSGNSDVVDIHNFSEIPQDFKHLENSFKATVRLRTTRIYSNLKATILPMIHSMNPSFVWTTPEAAVKEKRRLGLPSVNIEQMLVGGGASDDNNGDGSGVIIDKSGKVATAWHCVDGKKFLKNKETGTDLELVEVKVEVQVLQKDGTFKTYPARTIKKNEKADSAIVQILSDKKDFPFAKFASSNPTSDNEAFSLGYTGGKHMRLKKQVVKKAKFKSSKNKDESKNSNFDFDSYQAASSFERINGKVQGDPTTLIEGDSGGPLFNKKGEILALASNRHESISDKMMMIDTFDENGRVISTKQDTTKKVEGVAAQSVYTNSQNLLALDSGFLKNDLTSNELYSQAYQPDKQNIVPQPIGDNNQIAQNPVPGDSAPAPQVSSAPVPTDSVPAPQVSSAPAPAPINENSHQLPAAPQGPEIANNVISQPLHQDFNQSQENALPDSFQDEQGRTLIKISHGTYMYKEDFDKYGSNSQLNGNSQNGQNFAAQPNQQFQGQQFSQPSQGQIGGSNQLPNTFTDESGRVLIRQSDGNYMYKEDIERNAQSMGNEQMGQFQPQIQNQQFEPNMQMQQEQGHQYQQINQDQARVQHHTEGYSDQIQPMTNTQPQQSVSQQPVSNQLAQPQYAQARPIGNGSGTIMKNGKVYVKQANGQYMTMEEIINYSN